jgi:hypothetical protein
MLPHEPSSPSLLLAASHLFTVEVASERPRRWTLVSCLKGRLDAVEGDAVPWIEPAFDPVAARAGARFFVAALGPGGRGVRPWIGPRRAVWGIEHAGDVQAAEEAEAALAQASSDGDATLPASGSTARALEAARAVVAVAARRSDVAHRLFGEYVFARIATPLRRGYRLSPRPAATGPLLAELFAVVSGEACTGELREYILQQAARLARKASNRHLERDIARALLHQLIAWRGGSAHRLVDGSIYPVLFDVRGRPRLRSCDVISDPQRRDGAARALGRVRGDRAPRIAAWLASEERVVARRVGIAPDE